MAGPEKTFEKVLANGVVSFNDFQPLLNALGFRLDRVKGSHHIYLHPDLPRPINIQKVGNDAKRYQVRQLRDIIDEFDLKLED